jgi:hypothetical protein
MKIIQQNKKKRTKEKKYENLSAALYANIIQKAFRNMDFQRCFWHEICFFCGLIFGCLQVNVNKDPHGKIKVKQKFL